MSVHALRAALAVSLLLCGSALLAGPRPQAGQRPAPDARGEGQSPAPTAQAPAQQPAAPVLPPRISSAERRDIQQIVAAYRRAGKSADKVRATVQKAVASGPHTAAALAPLLAEDLQKLINRHLGLLSATAGKVAARSTPDPAEIAACREQVLSLVGVEELSKEMIVSQAEPALARLQELLRVDAATVLAEDKQLPASRAAVLELGSLWRLCAAAGNPPQPGPTSEPIETSLESLLAVEEELALLSPQLIDRAAQQVLAHNRATAGLVDVEEYRGVQILNGWRLMLGLNPLVHDVNLTLAARDHSHDMIVHKFFAHDSPVEGKRSPGDRARRFDTTSHAENIHHGSRAADGAMLAWFHSPGHFKNLFRPHARVGLGRVARHYTQMFGG